ncbi:MAG: response regulator [Gammaproteobacteria bacterium]|nr:response regulator [Gammaproteobacteria bacterium]
MDMDSQKKEKVLVIDDVAANIEILDAALQDEYEVLIATSGEEGLAAVVEERPDLILLDIRMPEMDGYEVCRKLKADPKTREIPVIFVTVMNDMENEAKGLELGATDYIAKPVSPPIVKARIRNCLDLKQAIKVLAEKNKKLEETAILRENVERITRHDIKTPLSGIINIPEILMRDPALAEEHKGLLKIAAEGGRRILEMVNRSLDVYKMETGTYCYEPVTVNVLPLFHKIIREMEQLSTKKDMSIEIRVHGRPAAKEDRFAVQGEPLLCYSLFANLIKNAVEASPEKEIVTLSVEKKEEECFITIHNRGAVPERIRERFFEKYVTAGKFQGTGLGTYSAKLMAETQGGGIALQTSAENGTAITVRLGKAADEEYVMAPPDGSGGDESTAARKMEAVPPLPLLEQIHELARIGHIHNISDKLSEIERAGEQYLPFAAEVRKLADNFQSRKIRKFVETYLDDQ